MGDVGFELPFKDFKVYRFHSGVTSPRNGVIYVQI